MVVWRLHNSNKYPIEELQAKKKIWFVNEFYQQIKKIFFTLEGVIWNVCTSGGREFACWEMSVSL